MTTIVMRNNQPSRSFGDSVKGLLDDFEALQEKKRETEDIQTLSATKGDPAALREAMKSMRSKRGKTLALGQLGQVPTKLEELEVENKKNMIDVYLGRTAAVGERQQAALDQKRFSLPEMEKVADLVKEVIPRMKGLGKGFAMDKSQASAAIQKIRETVGYDQLGQGQKRQIDSYIMEHFNKLNKGEGALHLKNQYEVPDGLAQEAAPQADAAQPIADFPELTPRMGNLSPERRKMVDDLIRRGVPKEKIIEAIDRDLGLR